MMELLNFIFQDFSHYIGFIILILFAGGVTANIFKSIRLFEIHKQTQSTLPTNQPQVNQGVFNDLLTLWNKRKGDSNNNQK
jgi:hypothetical protein